MEHQHSALNDIIKKLNNNELIEFLNNSGYEELGKILAKNNIDGAKFLNLTEIKIATWKLGPNRPLVWRNIMEIKANPQKILKGIPKNANRFSKKNENTSITQHKVLKEKLENLPKRNMNKFNTSLLQNQLKLEDESPNEYLAMDKPPSSATLIPSNFEVCYDEHGYLKPTLFTKTDEQPDYYEPKNLPDTTNNLKTAFNTFPIRIRNKDASDSKNQQRIKSSNFGKSQPPLPPRRMSTVSLTNNEQYENINKELSDINEENGPYTFRGILKKISKSVLNRKEIIIYQRIERNLPKPEEIPVTQESKQIYENISNSEMNRRTLQSANTENKIKPTFQSRPLPSLPEFSFKPKTSPTHQFAFQSNTFTPSPTIDSNADFSSTELLYENPENVSETNEVTTQFKDKLQLIDSANASDNYINLPLHKSPVNFQTKDLSQSPSKFQNIHGQLSKIKLPLPPNNFYVTDGNSPTEDSAITGNSPVLSNDEEQEIYGSFVSNINDEKFYRNTDRKGAKALLHGLQDGAFLFRPTRSKKFFLSLTIKKAHSFFNIHVEKTDYNKIRCQPENENMSPEFATLDDFIAYFSQKPLTFRHGDDIIVVYLNKCLPDNRF